MSGFTPAPAPCDGGNCCPPPVARINQRVRDGDGFYATVLYVGPVASAKNQKETYVGVEWDDDTRGKHDGSVISRSTNAIVRHFKCESSSPTAGSFVKPSKLDFGVDFATTLSNRYVDPDAPLLAPGNKFDGCVAMTKGGRPKQIEFYGEEKIRSRQQVDVITKVALRGEGVSHAGGEPGKIADYAGHLTEVDLQGNMLSDWEEVGKIISQLSALETLHLNANRLCNPLPLPPSLAAASASGGFKVLRRLILNGTNLKGWSALQPFTGVFPNLEELYLAENNFSDILASTSSSGRKVSGFESLELLDVSGCGLTEWEQLLCFSGLPKLKSLIMNENDITTIGAVNPDTEFKDLAVMQISGTKMASWSGIDNLNTFPSLASLRFGKSPITSVMGGSEARSVVIARVGRLDYLNGSVVREKERVEAEKMYVRRVAREITLALSSPSSETKKTDDSDSGGAEADAKKAAVIARHPAFEDLARKHAASMLPVGDGGSGGSSLGADTINVTIHSMAAASCTTDPMSKRLPASLNIGRLKQMCKRAFKLDVDLQILQFKADKDSLLTPLDSDDNTLAYYGVCDGSQVFMNEVDVKAKARQAEKEKEAEREAEQRMQKQEDGAKMMMGVQQMQIDQERKAVAAASVSK
mmetsp:Transcript_5190/g.10972  ORF Transcript_5190/g.10972 Transcript_5190/m.10972 type:complete len:641 (+) Transcript_5190:181-2103(+)|eukprot:CAMPEP_0197555980 /NCGR_PEP_ID=MMETSP1320-20131121/14313_1 /TAXON_ID=91990 /ORGANISM="Bolidomonas sp., Strain RCC2347" /LENGTH=640 /DNA_ID=CAMNT_0043117059 /DNA_START=163 /DNA_END=2085 /DNA_ORIENTATION=+